jgi:hypothetical protein
VITRRAFVINVFADGVVSDSDDVLLTGVPPVKRRKMQGSFSIVHSDRQKLIINN